MSSRWIERIRYSEGFSSEEEARKWLDEGLKRFSEIENEIRKFHEEMLRLTERMFEPFYREVTPTTSEITQLQPQDLISRIENLERELRELKELVRQKYIKAKVELH